ncbi:hypothetical protein [Absidia glauca]|uniref:FAR1 domain-containing protein n=1 Tax=Absidia glauca TaxID=4829 RepID=A0A163TCE2_ABSGL|nr:hypothetical protein [Absidia glauca]
MEYLELFGSYDPEYDHDGDFQEPLLSMRRRSQLLEDMTDDEGLDEEPTNILSVAPAPEQLTFSSGEELYDTLKIITGPMGLLFRSSMEIKCDLGGINISESAGKRLAKSRRIDCPFKWKTSLKTVFQDGLRLEQSTLVMENSGHCHSPADTLSGHSRACVLDDEQNKIVKEMTETGSGAVAIVSYLQNKYPTQSFRPKAIYNARQKIRRNYLDGRSPLQALMD